MLILEKIRPGSGFLQALLAGLFLFIGIGLIYCDLWGLGLGLILGVIGLFFIYWDVKKTVLFLIVLAPISRFPYLTEHLAVIKFILFSVVFIAWLIKKEFKIKDLLLSTPLTIIFAVFSLLILINMSIASNFAYALPIVITHFIGFSFFYVFIDLFHDEDFLKKAFNFMLILGVLIGLLACLQYFIVKYRIFLNIMSIFLPKSFDIGLQLQPMYQFSQQGFRSIGTFFHANMLGIYLSMIFPLNLVFLITASKKWKKLFLTIGLILIVSGIFFSNSKGAALNILISLTFIIIVFRKKISKAWLFSVLGIFLVILFFYYNNFQTYYRISQGISSRQIIWHNSVSLLIERPFWGCGLGNFFNEYVGRFGLISLKDFRIALASIVIDRNMSILQSYTGHNVFLNYAVEMGIFGAGLIGYFYFLYLKLCFNCLKLRGIMNDFDFEILVACTAMGMGNFAHSFFETITNFYALSLSFPFIIMIAGGMWIVSKYKTRTLTDK
ncbi:MAG: O-antigen ligase family protein [Candidatus Omnitrophota bacterium]